VAPWRPRAFAQDARETAAAVRAIAPSRAGLAFRTALCIAVPLAVGLAVGRPEAGAAASFGGLAGIYVPQSPYRYRARVVATVGVGLVAAVLLGGVAAPSIVSAVLVTGAVAGVASFVCQAAELPPPRELMLVMAVLAATEIPLGAGAALERAGLAAAGAAFAWLVTMSPALLGRAQEPERRAVTAAFGSVADLLECIGTGRAAGARHGAITAVRRAQAAVGQAALASGHPLARAIVTAEALLEAALHIEVEAWTSLDPRWAAAVRALVPSVGGGSTADVPLPDAGSTVGADILGAAIEDARAELGGGSTTPPLRQPPRWPGIGPQLVASVRRHSVVAPAAVRLGIAVALGVGLGRALGLGHAYWVGLTAAAVLQGSNLSVTRSRVVHRVAGTAVGVGLAFAVLGWGPPLWVVVLVAAVCQGLVELVIATHYGLAVVAITVLALMLFHIGAPAEDVGGSIVARLVDTGLGAAMALLLRQVLWPRATSKRVPEIQARTVRAIRDVLDAAWTHGGSEELAGERRRLQGDLAALRAVHAAALADSGSQAADARWPVSVAVEELGFLALSWPAHRPGPGAEDARAFLHHLDQVGDGVGGNGGPVSETPSLPGQPRTSAATAALAAAVKELNRA
jgi:uncharacterized membrane protein YccC